MKIPSELQLYQHFVLRGGPTGKAPVNTYGQPYHWNNPSTWLTAGEAIEIHESDPTKFAGIGFIVSREPSLKNYQVIGGDIDNCRDPITGEISQNAKRILDVLNTCVSVSPSKVGLRFFLVGKLPEDIDSVSWHEPDDLSDEMKANIIAAKPTIQEKLDKGQEVWNGIEIYENGRHLTLTDDWLTEYPEELEYRHEELLSLCDSHYKKVKKIISSAKTASSKLPFLDILRVIDVSEFNMTGGQYAGPHPVFGSTTGQNLYVKPEDNTWYCFHAGSECGGDAWLWLAAEAKIIDWTDCKPGGLCDADKIQKLKEYAISHGLFALKELFPKRAKALETVQNILPSGTKVFDPNKVFEPSVIEALAIIKMEMPSEFTKTRAALKGKVSAVELNRAIAAKESEIINKNRDNSYIVFDERKNPELQVVTLATDILNELNIHVVSGTRNKLAMYRKEEGIYEIGDAAKRKIDKNAFSKVIDSGDPQAKIISTQALSKIERFISSHAPEIGDAFEQHRHLLCVGNGVVNLKTGELEPFNPDYLMVENTSVNYNNDKPWQEQAPMWEKALNETFDGDPEKIEYFKRVMGYCATGETRSDAVFCLFGIAGTGKSTMIDTVMKALSSSNKVNGYGTMLKADLQSANYGSARDGIARAKYKRLIIAKELDERNDLSWGTIKELASTSSAIEVRELYGRTENIVPKFKLVFDTNHMPKCETPDNSILRRLKIIPFRHVFTNKNELTARNLEGELEGILHWIVEGARCYYTEGLGNPKFLDEELSYYRSDMDPFFISAWFENGNYVIESSMSKIESELWVKSASVYKNYKEYCGLEGVVNVATDVKISEFLKNRGGIKKQSKRSIIFEGKVVEDRSTFWINIRENK